MLKLREHQHFFLALRKSARTTTSSVQTWRYLQVDSPTIPRIELGDLRFALMHEHG